MVRAPFVLQKIEINTSTGQASGDRWYVVPFQSHRYRTLVRESYFTITWNYAYGRGQYVGTELHEDKSWRKA